MVIFVGTKVDKKMVQIRQSNEEDAEVITGFQIKMALETENMVLDPETVSQGVLNVYRNPGKGKYVVAVEGEQIVGGLLLTY
ncbi:MAG: hypothetical protein COZ08_12220, partial [Bacteroidetes bacterium CG_4_10_14_3_um_filter_42_6]